MYVLVTSFDPLRIYLYEDGLVRIATEEYSGRLQKATHQIVLKMVSDLT